MKPAYYREIGQNRVIEVPYLVIGSGIAGMLLALKLSEQRSVLLVAKDTLHETNSYYAQGGIASVLDGTDSFDSHIQDTLTAGAGLCREDVVRTIVEGGPDLINELIQYGVEFSQTDGESGEDGANYHLTKEGGHTHRRVIHAADVTGQAVMQALVKAARARENITILEHQMAVDLLTTDKYAPSFSENRCLGAYILDRDSQNIFQVRSDATFLATGGHGKAYFYTSNPDTATGDGLAMGWRAGCKVANLEFMQFHPTCLYHPKAKNFLISEAVRGEGGVLRNLEGRDFVRDYHPDGSLAPRDVVARAIDSEMKRTGAPHVYLDARELGPERIGQHFPNIQRVCQEFGIDMVSEQIPVVPAAHYSCGGLVSDLNGGTNVAGLYALGEVACTGLHGANRLASNSLLEAAVMAHRVADHAKGLARPAKVDVEVPAWNPVGYVPEDDVVVLRHTWDEIRRLMWNYVGIVRSDKRLSRALDRITAIREELDRYYWDYNVTDNLLEVRNLALVAYLTIRCALSRKESRGIHYMLDYPQPNERYGRRDTVMR